jgi:hypothetical protein
MYTLVKLQKTPVFIGDVTLAHLSHLFLGVPEGEASQGTIRPG